MKESAQFALDKIDTQKVTGFIQQCLKKFNPQRNSTKTTQIAGEAIDSLIAHSGKDGELWVTVQKILGRTTIEMSAPGDEYNLLDNIRSVTVPRDQEVGREALDDIRIIMLRSVAGDLRYRHSEGYNYVRMTLYRYKRIFLFKTLFALFSAIIIALLLSAFAPEAFNRGLDDCVLSPVKTAFFNVLRLIVSPVVFFSIVSCVGGFSSLRELGSIGSKTILTYLLTSIAAVFIGIGVFYLIQPGSPHMASTVAVTDPSAGAVEISLIDTLVGMFPSNIVSPFLNDNMSQLIFIAILCGVANSLIGQYSAVLKSLFDACNELFMKIAGIIVRFMPIIVFCSAMSMILNTGARALLSILGMFTTFLIGLLCMVIFYMIFIPVVSGLSPMPLLRKYAPTMLQVFALASSNAAIPINMDVCQKKLGINPKISNLSIPLGSTLNMHGTCILLSVFALALARVYGVPVLGGGIIALALTIVILSIGAPGIPGGVVICLSVLLEQLHVPAEGVSLIIGIGPLLGMFICMTNCLGDVVVTTVIAKKTGEISTEIYNQKG